MGKNIPPELDNPRAEKILAEEAVKNGQEFLNMEEIITAELDLRLGEIEVLIGELTIKYEGFIENKNLSKKEESNLKKKIIGAFEKKLLKIKKKKNKEGRLKDLNILKTEVEEISKMEIDDYLKYLDNEKILEEKFDSFENKEMVVVPAVVEPESGLADTEQEVTVTEDLSQEKVSLDNSSGDDEIALEKVESIAKTKNIEESERKRIAEDIKEFITEMDASLLEFEERKNKFTESFPEAKKMIEDMEKTKQAYKNKLEDFKTLDESEYSQNKLVEINQLHHRLGKVLEVDWIGIYREKMGIKNDAGEFLKNSSGKNIEDNGILSDENGEEQDEDILTKVEGVILEDLLDYEYEGAHSPVVEKIDRRGKQEFLDNLIKKYGEAGTTYIKYSEEGDLIGKVSIVEYDLNNPEHFVILNIKNGNKKGEEKKLELSELNDFLKEYIHEDLLNIREDIEVENEGKIEVDEQKELEIFVKERIVEVDNLLRESETEFSKIEKGNYPKESKERIEKKFLLYKFSLVNIKNVIAKDENIFKSQSILNLVEELYVKIKTLEDEINNGVNEADKFLESLTERERQTLEKIGELIEETKSGIKEGFDWGKLSERRIDQMVEDQVIIFLMNNFTKGGLFVDREEIAAEYILKNKK